MKRSALLFALVVSLFAPPVLSAQSIGEAAKQAAIQAAKKAAEKNSTAKPTRVYTDKDPASSVPDGVAPPEYVPPPPLVEAPAQSEGARQAEYRKSAKKDEAYWKARMHAADDTLNADRTFLAAAVVRESALDKRIHIPKDSNDYIVDRRLRTEVEAEWQQALAEVSRIRAAVANDQRAIAMAIEEARQADAPPGWLRW